MAGSRHKVVKQVKNPRNRCIPATRDSDEYYSKNPCWNFNTCDDELWPLDEEHAADYFWHEILPRLKEFEKCKVSDQ